MNVTVKSSVNNRTLLALEKLQRITDRWLTADEQRLINRCNKQANRNADASFFYMLYRDYGFTAEKLLELYNNHKAEYGEIDSAECALTDLPCVQKLKDIKFDITELYGE